MDASPPARRQMFPTVSAPRLRRLSEVRDEVRDTQSEVRDTHAPDQFMGVLGLLFRQKTGCPALSPNPAVNSDLAHEAAQGRLP